MSKNYPIVVLSDAKVINVIINDLKNLVSPDLIIGIKKTKDLHSTIKKFGKIETLISYGTSQIVSKDILERVNKVAVNLHAASPNYPGRDPHHFAIYDDVDDYGVTLHFMDEKVDSGNIIDVLYFPIPKETSGEDLLDLTEKYALKLLFKWLPYIVKGNVKNNSKFVWSGQKRGRKQFLMMTQLRSTISKEEIDKKIKSFHVNGFNNLSIDIHENRFRWEKKLFHEDKINWHDFTEAKYSDLLDFTKKRMKFLFFTDDWKDFPHTLWRHDVDISPHRALSLAKIEQSKGIKTTYFIQLDSIFYDLNDPSVIRCLDEIKGMNHQFGLHYHINSNGDGNLSTIEAKKNIFNAKNLLEKKIKTQIKALSFHNPSKEVLSTLNQQEISGLVNSYSSKLAEKYQYCSDSNGYWRHKSLFDVVSDDNVRFLHALTHPVWWTPEPLPPLKRIERCANGRAEYMINMHKKTSQEHGRKCQGWKPIFE